MYGMSAAPTSTNVGTRTPGDRRVEVGQQLLEAQEVPRRLGHGRRHVAVGQLLERRVDEQAHQQQEDAHHAGREELDREQVRPGHDRVVGFLLDPDDGVLLDEREQPVRPRRHRHALLVDLGPPGRVDRAATTRAVRSGPSRQSSVSSQRPADAAVLADAPEVDGQEDRGDERQEHDVEHVEAQQRVLADLEAAEQEQLRRAC